MARFCGKIGYAETKKISPGRWEPVFVERIYRGDVIRMRRQWETGDSANDNLNINNEISIVADAYAYEHFHAIKYIEWMGVKWKVKTVEVQRPRLILTVGGVYNEDTL